jgi:hypothetical protein
MTTTTCTPPDQPLWVGYIRQSRLRKWQRCCVGHTEEQVWDWLLTHAPRGHDKTVCRAGTDPNMSKRTR